LCLLIGFHDPKCSQLRHRCQYMPLGQRPKLIIHRRGLSRDDAGVKQLSTSQRAAVIGALCEGNSINSTVRMVGVSQPTILKLIADLGKAFQRSHDAF
jgi:hypothetical protein